MISFYQTSYQSETHEAKRPERHNRKKAAGAIGEKRYQRITFEREIQKNVPERETLQKENKLLQSQQKKIQKK